jgi:N-acetylglucosamine kinase-like BadF-type ATPase
MANKEVLAVDLGQSGSRFRQGQVSVSSDRGKVAGENPLPALRAVFESTQKFEADVVALSCTGFYGVVSEPEKYLQLCQEFFGAKEVAVIDDGLAGFVGALGGRNGVVLSVGGGVVAIGGLNGHYAHRDGLGNTFGDEGSGFWLGKLAITKALALRQGRGDDPEMVDYFADEIAQYFALEIRNSVDAVNLATRTAKKVLDAADAGVSTATAIVDEGAFLLAQSAVAAWYGCGGTKADSPEIVIQGGPVRNTSYSTKIALEINAKLPNAVVVKSAGDNLDGATWITQNSRQDAPPLLLWASL